MFRTTSGYERNLISKLASGGHIVYNKGPMGKSFYVNGDVKERVMSNSVETLLDNGFLEYIDENENKITLVEGKCHDWYKTDK